MKARMFCYFPNNQNFKKWRIEERQASKRKREHSEELNKKVIKSQNIFIIRSYRVIMRFFLIRNPTITLVNLVSKNKI